MKVFALLLILSAALSAATFSKFLATLDIARPESLCQANRRFASEFPDLRNPGQPAAMFALWSFHERAAGIVNLGPGLRIFDGVPQPEQEKAIDILRKTRPASPSRELAATTPNVWRNARPWLDCGYGIVADFDETILLDPDPRFELRFADRLQPDCLAYLNLYLKESPNWLDYDGALAIPWDRLRARIGRWERFRAEHPGTPELTAHISAAIHTMMQFYLCGMSNSPAFDDKGRIAGHVRQSFRQFLAINTDSPELPLIRQASEILERNGGRLNRELINLYRRHGYHTEVLTRDQ